MPDRPVVVEMEDPFQLIRKSADLLAGLEQGKLLSTEECCTILAHVHAARDVLNHAFEELSAQLKTQGIEFTGGYWQGASPLPGFNVTRVEPGATQH